MGNLTWWPNRQGIEWFQRSVLSQLPSEQFQLHVFGLGSEGYHRSPNVFGHGFVKELSDIWSAVDCMVQPILSGAGVNIKVAETLYNGIPMLGTIHSTRGLALDQDEAIVLMHNEQEWVQFMRKAAFERFLTRRPSTRNRAQFSQAEATGRLKALLSDT